MNTTFGDTNIILRYLISVIAEVVFVLSSKKHYSLSAEEIKKRLMPILAIRGLKLEHQPTLKRAVEVAAADGGKTLIDHSMPGILPRLSIEEALDVIRIHSVADQLPSSARPVAIIRRGR